MGKTIQETSPIQRPSTSGTGRLQIQLLDRMVIHYDGHGVDGALKKSKKARKLIAYLLLLRGMPAPVYKLYDVLWGQMDIDNPESALKTLVSRTRAMLAVANPKLRDCIVAEASAYRWNTDITQEVDVFRIELLCEEIMHSQTITDTWAAQVDRLLCLYTGALLPDISEEDWVIVHALRLEERYKTAVLHTITLWNEQKEWEHVVKTCRMALMRLPLDEDVHAELIQALIVQGRRTEAMNQYKHVMDLHWKYLGVQPTARIRDIYKQIIKTDSKMEQDIDSISKELKEADEMAGAFFCEYAIFKDIYRLQLRSLERFRIDAYLSIVRVGTMGDVMIPHMVLEEAMEKLLQVLTKSLRKCDTITRYSATQFAILLQGPTHETIQSIMDRIKLTFYKMTGNTSLTLDYLYMPLRISPPM